MIGSSFAAIMRHAVEATPGAIGGAFAAEDGELVDGFTTQAPDDWAFLTAHYGVLLRQLESAFGTWHYGGPIEVVLEHRLVDVLIQPVREGYFALLAVAQPAPLAIAQLALTAAVRRLREEM